MSPLVVRKFGHDRMSPIAIRGFPGSETVTSSFQRDLIVRQREAVMGNCVLPRIPGRLYVGVAEARKIVVRERASMIVGPFVVVRHA